MNTTIREFIEKFNAKKVYADGAKIYIEKEYIQNLSNNELDELKTFMTENKEEILNAIDEMKKEEAINEFIEGNEEQCTFWLGKFLGLTKIGVTIFDEEVQQEVFEKIPEQLKEFINVSETIVHMSGTEVVKLLQEENKRREENDPEKLAIAKAKETNQEVLIETFANEIETDISFNIERYGRYATPSDEIVCKLISKTIS